MKKIIISTFIGTVVSIFLSATSFADVIFEQPWSDIFNGASSRTDSQQIADDFTLSETKTITDVHWYGISTDGNLDGISSMDFVLRFYENEDIAPGQPNQLSDRPALDPFYEQTIAASITDTGNSIFVPANPVGRTLGLFEFWAETIPQVTLTGGEEYWLSILEIPGLSVFDWAFADFGAAVFRPCCNSDGTDWLEASSNTNFAFALTDDSIIVSEPGTFGILSFGLVGLWLAGRRRKLRKN